MGINMLPRIGLNRLWLINLISSKYFEVFPADSISSIGIEYYFKRPSCCVLQKSAAVVLFNLTQRAAGTL